MTKDAPGMRGVRARNKSGPLRDKRDDTHVSTVEEKYNRDFGVRGDMQLGTLLDKLDVASLNDLIKSKHGRK